MSTVQLGRQSSYLRKTKTPPRRDGALFVLTPQHQYCFSALQPIGTYCQAISPASDSAAAPTGKVTDMEARSLMRINAHEERLFPVGIKVKMLMEQASMRMRASRMVGERISQLDDVIRVRSLLCIVGQSKRKLDAVDSTSTPRSYKDHSNQGTNPSSSTAVPRSEGEGTGACFAPCGEADIAEFTRMAVSSMKTVLFQVVDEDAVDNAKDISLLYEGLITTAALKADAAEGFCNLDVDSLLSAEHTTYRKLVVSRHRYVVSSRVQIQILQIIHPGCITLYSYIHNPQKTRTDVIDILKFARKL